jgi:hypothetical protein
LQVQVCDRFGLTVTVCHYPTGCSKWNPIERGLFSQISRNWAGVPLRTWTTLLAFIRGKATAPGLTVQAIFENRDYPIGQKVTGTRRLERLEENIGAAEVQLTSDNLRDIEHARDQSIGHAQRTRRKRV